MEIKILCLTLLLYYVYSITVHVIPHTHDDAGWLWTFDQYYNGDGSPYSVKSILDNMVISLNHNKNRTFIYVEMAFFTKWYLNQTEIIKTEVKMLVKEGRLEFINGGYVMHDEATSYYEHLIDQMRLGLLFLKSEFDYKPDIAWFIDPFGHTSANAYILKKMGFDKIAFVRIDQKEKDIRKNEKKLEFYWRPFSEYDKDKIFTHITYEHYCPPNGMDKFDKDIRLKNDEIIKQAKSIHDDLKKWNSGYNHENLLLMFGCDFTFNKADANYENIEVLMDYINNNFQDMNLIYSTPSIYFKTIFESASNWPIYDNYDFLPYSDYPYSYWTGYYTSRPFLKGIIRETGNYLKTGSQFIIEFMLSNQIIEKTDLDHLFKVRENLAICQHHDAVSGTAKELVSQDYISKLSNSIERIKLVFENVLKKNLINLIPNIHFKSCVMSFTNSDCFEMLDIKDKTYINIYNPGLNGIYPISFETRDINFKILDEDNQEIVFDSFCLNDDLFQDEYICRISFYYKFDKSVSLSSIIFKKTKNNGNKISTIENINLIYEEDDFKILFYKDNLQLEIVNSTNKHFNMSLYHSYYNSFNGNNSDFKPKDVNPSGAYVLSTTELEDIKYNFDENKSFFSFGNNFYHIVLRFDNSYLIIRIILKPFLMLELESIWDPIIPVKSAKELLLHVKSDIKNNVNITEKIIQPEFWTDSNGLKLMRRFKDYRQGYNYTVTEQVASNFYPVNYIFSIRERENYIYNDNDYVSKDGRILNIFTERSESIGVMKEGEIMIILNRYSEKDDWKGLDEALFERSSSGYFKIKHWINFDNQNLSYMRKYIHERIGLFTQIKEPKRFKEKFNYGNLSYLENILKLGLDKRSNIFKLFTKTENISVNYHILNEKEFFVQAFNLCDKYFRCDNEEYIKFIYNSKYRIEEYHVSGTKLIGEIDYISEYNIKAQDFKLFKISID